MDAGVVLGGAFAAAGAVAVAAGLVTSASHRRPEDFATYLDHLDRDDSAVATGSGDVGAASVRSATVAGGGGGGGTKATSGSTEPAEHTSLFEQRLAQPLIDRTLRPAFDRIVGIVSLVTPADHRARVRAKLGAAGLDATRRPEELIAMQVAGFVAGLVLGGLLLASGALGLALAIACALLLVVGGAAAPLVWLSHRVDARIQAIRHDMPDCLDLLAISVEAGVGLEGALQVVAERSNSPLALEMGRTLQEMGLGLSRKDALINLKNRSQVPELSSFVQALIQADGLGMPLSRVLKIQATEMRAKRRQWAREKAAKLPVKILFPLVMCIFPAVLVIIVGPAMSQIGQALK